MSDTDIRDEAVRRLLDGAVVGIESAPSIDGVLRRGSRRRAVRVVASATALAVFVGAVAWSAAELRGGPTTPQPAATLLRYGTLAESGWTVSYPDGWYLTPVAGCAADQDRGGFVLSDTDFKFRDPQGEMPGCGDGLVLDGFPKDGVGVALMPIDVPREASIATTTNTIFPVDLDAMVQTSRDADPGEFTRAIVVGHLLRAVLQVWIGPDASLANRAALADLVWSLRYRGADLGMGFAPSDGWQTRTHLNRSPRDLLPTAVSASNVGFTEKGNKFLWDTTLPPDGIRITAWFVDEGRPASPNPNFPPGELPLRVPEQLDDSWEGYPDPTGALRRGSIWVQVNGWDLQVWVLFGSDPSKEMRDVAQAELNRLFVPPERPQASP